MKSSPVVFVVCLLLVVPGLVVAQPLVHPDGSVDPVPGSLEPPVSSGIIIQQTTTTITFNDLFSSEVVATDRYAAQGVLIETGPGSTEPGIVTGSQFAGPCNGTRSIQTEPFTGPSFLFRFPAGASDVTLSSGDWGPSDEDVITLTAYGDHALTTVVASDTVTLAEGAPMSCLGLTVAADRIAAVELTSAGSYPNSIFVDDLTFTPAPIVPSDYFTLSPCRIVDTRNPAGPLGGPELAGGTTRTFTLAGNCGIPATAQAVAVNLTVTSPSAAGFLTAFAAGTPPPGTSNISFSPGQTRANNAILQLGAGGDAAVLCGMPPASATHFVLDVLGYFE